VSCANRSKSALILLLFVVLGGWGGPWGLARAEPVLVHPQAEQMDLSDRLALLPDPERRLSYPAILALRDEFRPVTRQELVTSFNAGVFWLHLSLRQQGAQPLTRWLAVGTAKTPRVALYEPAPGGEGWRVSWSGRGVARDDKPVVAVVPMFALTLLPGEARELWLRVDASGATDMAPILWDPLAYLESAGRQQMWQAAVIGGMLVSTFLALLAFAHLREAQYFWLALMLMGVIGLEVARENLLGTYFWPAQFAPPPQLLAGFALIALFGESKLAAHALGLAHAWPAADRLLRLLRWSAVAGALITLISYGQGVRVLSITALVLHGAMITLAVLVWRRGQRMARIFLFAFSLALLTETARQLANLGLLPWIAAMNFSLFFYLLASPFLLLGLVEQTRVLHQRLQLASQLQQAKSDFLARVSHELRSPLNTILGYNRMLARRSARLSLAEGTAGIEKSVLRLLALIDELLDEARLAAGKLVVRPAPLALRTWLEEIAQTARLPVQAKGNELVPDFAGESAIRILADGERLRQVLENLLNNANRHTEQGRIRFACAVSTEGPEARIDFAVEDSGEGMDERELSLIFEPFSRGESHGEGPGKKREESPEESYGKGRVENREERHGAGREEGRQGGCPEDHGKPVLREGSGRGNGFGLGLSICRELVRQMGSDILVQSAPGQGSRFSFSLRCPLIAEEGLTHREEGETRASDVLAGDAPDAPDAGDVQTHPGFPRVLVIEDDPLQLEVLKSILADGGFLVGGAKGGGEGIADLEAGDWDAVITDQLMAAGDGWWTLRQVRDRKPGLPVVLVSASPPLRPDGFPDGLDFNATVLKPCVPEALLATLWYLILKPDQAAPAMTAPHWHALATLASEGDVSGIEDWIAARRAEAPYQARVLGWIEDRLHRLDLALLERLATQAAAGVVRSSPSRC